MIQHSISKGFDIRLTGRATPEIVDAPEPSVVAVQATDFRNVKPKLRVAEGDTVAVGDVLFFDKVNPDTVFVAPVAGTVSSVVLGKRRALQRVEITPSGEDRFADLPRIAADGAQSMGADAVVAALRGAGLWPMVRQRPVGKIADPTKRPVAIYVNGMDTEPLAADPGVALRGAGADLQAGIDVLRALSDKIVVTVRGGGEVAPELSGLSGVELHAFSGPHPAGLVGTHIHEIAPLKADQVAWTLRAQEAAQIGAWARTGQYPTHRVVAVAGSKAADRRYFRVRNGAALASLFGGAAADDLRLISGTVLTGHAVDPSEGYVGYATWTLTAIPEGGDTRDFFGWALPQVGKHSASRAVFSWLAPKAEYELDARKHGGPRAIVNIGAWERVTPLDIYPTFLVRAIQANDLEEAINLGLLEVTEEDVALCTFVDPCKIEVGEIIRKGLDLYETES